MERQLSRRGFMAGIAGASDEVIAIARETVAEQLAEPAIAERLVGLPLGDPDMISRPQRPSWEWPGIEELAARVGPA